MEEEKEVSIACDCGGQCPCHTTAPVEPKKRSMLEDGDGDLSSGRFVKVFAFVTSMITGLGSVVVSTYAWLGLEKMDAGQYTTLILGIIGIFIGAATANEITQKATGK